MPVRVAVIGAEVVSPLGLTADETWEALKAGKKGFKRLLFPPFTESQGDGLPPQIRATVGGTIENFNPKKALKGILPIKDILNKTDPFAQYEVYTAVGAARKVVTNDGRHLVIDRIGSDGKIDRNYPLTINPELVDPSQVGVYVGCGFGGGDVSADVMERLKGGNIPSPDDMLHELIDRSSSLVTVALNILGGGEGDVGACASSGKAGVNAIRSIMAGDNVVALWGGTEEVLTRPIASASFDAMGALDRGTDLDDVSLSFQKGRRGFVMAGGSVTLVLADPDWARQQGINVQYEIIGYGNTSDAGHDTQPNGFGGQRALLFSRRRAERQGLIEGKLLDSGHYTATPTGDGIEFMHTLSAYADLADQKRLMHGATKMFTGHMLGAAGAMGQFAAGRALQEGIVWGHPFAREVMDEAYGCDIPRETRSEPDLTDVLSKTFGFGGANVVFNSRRVR
jgi:3-oxoacyl-[acyl-carrier-protein] synthase II